MDKCADTLFILEDDGSISGFVGKCSEYIEYKTELEKQEKLEQKNKKGEVSPSRQPQSGATLSSGGSAPATPPEAKKQKLSFKEQREFESLDAEIPELEAEQKALEPDLGSSDFAKQQKATARYNEIAALLEEKYARWEELSERA